MNKLRLSPEAVRDLMGIQAYIAGELKNPAAAVRLVSSITSDLRILLRYAEAGPSVEAKTGQATDLRVLVCGEYLAFYRAEQETVSVARILHGRQDYLQILFKE